MTGDLLDGLIEQQQAGQPVGMTSICSAHPLVLDETIRHGAHGSHVVLIEATCNQVNQDGGYTGMRPADFRSDVMRRAQRHDLALDRLLLGGDHLGPNPWRDESAEVAMRKADTLVAEFVSAGYTKIHLDASMKCGDDVLDAPLSPNVIADRTARLAAAAEAAAPDRDVIRYVIGTEVPVPGGAGAADGGIHVTTAADVAETIALTRQAFERNGVGDAWQRVRLVVAQPGVEFSDTELFDYEPKAARHLAELIESQHGLVYEAHSTDYQTRDSLSALVRDHFAVLKVGPGLTFAYREGAYALSFIEDELLGDEASGLREVLDSAMTNDPSHWSAYYPSDPRAQALARQYSRSDRSRYYWPVPSVQAAVDQMMSNLRSQQIPAEMVSQFLPVQYAEFRDDRLELDPEELLRSKIREVLDDYLAATSHT